MISILDYGMGNLRSVNKAFDSMGFSSVVTADKNIIIESEGLVLPGVGAFGDCVKNLRKADLIDVILDYISIGKPFLGICLGLQVLFEESEESPDQKGLGLIKGKVVRFSFSKDQGLKVPHMGWNQINIARESTLLNGIPQNSWFYFVHSYYPIPQEDGVVAITTNYGSEFTAAIQKDNIFACQFHPEKSSDQGLRLLKNFAHICGQVYKERAV